LKNGETKLLLTNVHPLAYDKDKNSDFAFKLIQVMHAYRA